MGLGGAWRLKVVVGSVCGGLCQVMAQPLVVWVRPRLMSRRRLMAAARWASQSRLRSTPR